MKAKLVKTHGNHFDLWIDSKGLYTSTYQFTGNGNLLSRKNCKAIEEKLPNQTEWDVEIEMSITPSQKFNFEDIPYSKPKLDADGCLILIISK